MPLNIGSEPVVYFVESGSSLKRVLRDFEEKGWVRYAVFLEIWFRYKEKTNIQTGEYEIKPGDNSITIIEKFNSGKKILRSIQLIEGQTFKDFLNVIFSNTDITHTLQGLSDSDILAQVSPELTHGEGWFFPDTYLFEKGTSDLDILKLSYSRMKKILEAEWQNRSESAYVTTPYDALILASIIEKETGDASERGQISGVFTRRLEMGMRLQTDPTVIYGIGALYDGNITRKHLLTDTPYNTYTRKGLPPTPIANPGKEAIYAALHPKPGKTIYFVAKGDGTHQFSETFAEHNEAVKHYQRFRRREDYQSAPSLEAAP